MRIALLAAGYVGAKVIETMLQRRRPPALVILDGNFDGKGSEIRSRLFNNGLAEFTFDTEKVKSGEIASRIQELGIDIGILAWWPHIVGEPLLSSAKFGFLNFHPSLLPHNRGKHTTFWNFVEDTPFGVTIHWIDKGIDTGPIAFQRKVKKYWEDDSESLHKRARDEIVALFEAHLEEIVSGRIPRIPQDASGGKAHRAAEIESKSRIDLNSQYTGRALLNLIRGKQFPPHTPAFFEDDGAIFDLKISITRRPG